LVDIGDREECPLSYLGYTGRAATVVATPALDPGQEAAVGIGGEPGEGVEQIILIA
jgi:hypothetical protein